DVVAEREADLPLPQRVCERVRRTGGVGAGEDRRRIVALPILDVGRELGERGIEHGDMIGGGIRASIAGAQQPGQLLAGLVEEAVQRVEAEAALTVRRRRFLLRVAL